MNRFRNLSVAVLVLALGTAIFGCSERSVTGPPEAAPSELLGILPGLDIPLLDNLVTLALCRPQAYDSTTMVIGRRGGVIRAGRHTLEIPRGALRRNVEITMVAPGDRLSSARFYPEGLKFNRRHKPTLTLDHRNCLIPTRPSIAYISEDLRILEVLRGILLGRGTVSADIEHFSRYAVAW
ncbi:MAG: hypothetical protein ACREL6_05950 [Gemmatimonadales bacterium]